MFENDYWGVSVKELIKKSDFINKSTSKLALCGVEKENVKFYINKNKFSKVILVSTNENYDYVLMTNRVVWDHDALKNLDKAKTCFQKFQGDDLSSVKRNGLVLSTIRKKLD